MEQLSIGHAGLKLLDSHLRRFLRHQYNAQLHRRTQQIQEELVSEPTSCGSRVFTARTLSASSGELKHRRAISLAWSSVLMGEMLEVTQMLACFTSSHFAVWTHGTKCLTLVQ